MVNKNLFYHKGTKTQRFLKKSNLAASGREFNPKQLKIRLSESLTSSSSNSLCLCSADADWWCYLNLFLKISLLKLKYLLPVILHAYNIPVILSTCVKRFISFFRIFKFSNCIVMVNDQLNTRECITLTVFTHLDIAS